MQYRGIKLVEGGRLFKKDGSYNELIKNGLDSFVDLLEVYTILYDRII